MKKISFLMAIGLIGSLFSMPLLSQAETVTIVSNSNSGIEYATYTSTLTDGTVLGFCNRNEGVYFCGAISQKTALTVPDSVIFYSSSSTNSYPLPVNHIGYSRLDFDNAQSISSLTLPSSVTSLYNMAPTVKELHMNSYISSVRTSCLLDLTKVLVPESMLSSYLDDANWYEYVLINAEGTDPVKITINMTKPGEFAQLLLQRTGNDWKKVNELTVIGEMNIDDLKHFHKMRQLTSLDLSNAVIDELPGGTASDDLSGSRLLETVELPNLKSIGNFAFYGCSRLKSITLPSGLISIGERAFGNSGLRSLGIPNTVTTIKGYAFADCSDLLSVTIPPSVTSIGGSAFSNCTRLSNVVFTEGLVSIGYQAFNNCTALTEIDLPSSLCSVYRSFSYCHGIKKVICRAVTPPAQGSYEGILSNCDMTDVELYVPAISIVNYRTQPIWKLFFTILPMEERLTDVQIYDDITIDDSSLFASGCNFLLNCLHQLRNNVEQYYCGTVDFNSSSTLSLGDYNQIHYMGSAKSSNPYTYNSHHTALIARGPINATSVKTTLYTNVSNIWYFISLPYDVKVSDIIYPDGVQFAIRKYSGLNRAQSQTNTWLNLTNDSIMHAYEGYIFRCNRNDIASFTFPAMDNVNKNRVFERENVVMSLNEYLSELEYKRSWNLIGNPYPCYYDVRFLDFTAPITVWNRYDKRYDAYSPIDDSFILHPAQAFFVQRPVDKANITFDKEGRQKTDAVRTLNMSGKRIAGKRQLFNVSLANGETEDHTRFVFNDNASRSYELDKDASKLIAGDNSAMLVYTVEDGIRYAINERDYADGQVNLGFYAPEDGNYRLSIVTNSTENVTLIDHESENHISLLGEYSFKAKAGYNDGRFTLTFGQSGVMELNNDNVMIDVKDGIVSSNVCCKVYTIDGRMVGTCDANSTLNLEKGIYVICGNNVTRKIIVK